MDLLSDLRRLGVKPGDVVMPHASLRRIGARAEAVIEALDKAAGTVLMNVGPSNDEPFDALTTPVDPDIGVLAEVFRTTPGTLVTNHPEGRFGARGTLAAELLASPPWNDYYGPGSPLERLVQLGGKVLRLGADLSSLTLLHYAEYRVPLPGKRRVRRHRLVTTPAGPRVRTVECLDDSDGIVAYAGADYFADILEAYLASGKHRPTPTITARLNFQLAFGARIGQRLAQARDEAQREVVRSASRSRPGTEIALRNKEIELRDFYSQQSDARGTWQAHRASAGYSSAARRAGDKAGRRARLGNSSELPNGRAVLER